MWNNENDATALNMRRFCKSTVKLLHGISKKRIIRHFSISVYVCVCDAFIISWDWKCCIQPITILMWLLGSVYLYTIIVLSFHFIRTIRALRGAHIIERAFGLCTCTLQNLLHPTRNCFGQLKFNGNFSFNTSPEKHRLYIATMYNLNYIHYSSATIISWY